VQLDFFKKLYIYLQFKLIMDSIIAASVIAAGLSIGLSAIGPGIGQLAAGNKC
jgi:F0F1-type ATP synthase membrane subunit c/vacuolar-type H+-ATPase subunit K